MVIQHNYADRWEYGEALRAQREAKERIERHLILTNCDFCHEPYDYEPGKVYSECPNCMRMNKR